MDIRVALELMKAQKKLEAEKEIQEEAERKKKEPDFHSKYELSEGWKESDAT